MADPVGYKVIDQQWSPSDPAVVETMLTGTGQGGWQVTTIYPDPQRERTRWIFSQAGLPVSYKVLDQPWSPSDPTVIETMLNSVGQGGWTLAQAYPDPQRERTRWVFSSGPASSGGGIPDAPADGGLYGRQDAAWSPVVPGAQGPAGPQGSQGPVGPVGPAGPQGPAGAGSPSNSLPLMNGAASVGVSTNFTREDHVHPTDASRAPLASPAFTGAPTVPTAAPATNTAQAASTAFVGAALPLASAANPLVNGAAASGASAAWSRGDHVHPTDTTRAAQSSLANYLPLAGGTLSGPLVAPGGAGAAQAITIDAPSTNHRSVCGATAGLMRWRIDLGNVTAEAGGNAGSDLGFYNYSDGGAYLSNPMSIYRATGVCAFAQPIVNGSDRSLKTDIEPVTQALAMIGKLQGVYYRRKGGAPKREVGLIAQDVAPVIPEVVFATDPPRDDKGEPIAGADPLLGIAYANIVAVLIEAIKELTARVASLETGTQAR